MPTVEQLNAQATTMANIGGPGANAGAAQAWLLTQMNLYGYTNADGSAPATAPTNPNGTVPANLAFTVTPDGVFTPNLNNPVQAAQVGSGPAITNAATSWVSSHIGNYGLVILGGLLALGALLISQKDNITKVATTAAKVATV